MQRIPILSETDMSLFELKTRYTRNFLTFAGKNSKDFLLYISGPGVYDSPAVDVELQTIPGVCGVVPGSVLPDSYGIEAGQSAVGDIFRWFERSLAPAEYTSTGKTLVELEKDAAQLAPGESGLLALDWNNGNRCILVDTALTGAIVGATLSTTAAETYRALVESTAYGARAIV